MKKLLTIILLIVSANSYAEWTESDVSDEFTEYVDRATIRRNGNFVKMWDLADYKTVRKSASNDSYLSSKSQIEYDCKEEKSRILAFTRFSGQMGHGTVVYNSGAFEDTWSPISPESIGESLWKIACGKR
jgi:hypothetical protein